MDEEPETIEVVKYAPVKLRAGRLPEHVLEYLLEHLDEEYADPEGGWSEPTDEMKELAETFVAGVLAEYEPWACEPVSSEVVNIAEWRARNGSQNND